MFEPCNIAVFYASETGNSESLARQISLESIEKMSILFPNLQPGPKENGFKLSSINLIEEWLGNSDSSSASSKKLMIIIASSTGDGEPPESALKVYNNLLQKAKIPLASRNEDSFQDVFFALLGMGDKDYDDTFGKFPKDLFETLTKLGAKPLLPLQITDENDGIELVSEPWLQNFWALLEALICNKKRLAEEKSLDLKKDIPIDLTSETKEKSNTVVLEPQTTLNSVLNSTLPRLYDQKLNFQFQSTDSKIALTSLPRIPVEVCELKNLNLDRTFQNTKADQLDIPGFLYNIHPKLFKGKITKVKSLTAVSAVKRVLEIEVEIPSDTIQYTPGDVIGVHQSNDTHLVDLILTKLIPENKKKSQYNIQPKVGQLPSHLGKFSSASITPQELFSHIVDISNVCKKPVLRVLAQYCTDPNETYTLEYLVSKQGSLDFNNLRDQVPSLLDLLNLFPSSCPPIQRLLDVLSPLQPRYYSITTSPISSPSSIRLIFNVAQFYTQKLLRHGLFTPWVDIATGAVSSKENQNCSVELALFLKPSTPLSFYLPSNPRAPLILVGPGTGIAPLLGFVRHRQAQRSLARRAGSLSYHLEDDLASRFGPIWFVTGFRDPDKDFLIDQELFELVRDGTIHRLDVSFSRATHASFSLIHKGNNLPDSVFTHSKYVQDSLKSQSSYWCQLMLEKSAYFYLCGDAGNMAKDVNFTMLSILQDESGPNLSPASAAAQLLSWTKGGFVKRDLW